MFRSTTCCQAVSVYSMFLKRQRELMSRSVTFDNRGAALAAAYRGLTAEQRQSLEEAASREPSTRRKKVKSVEPVLSDYQRFVRRKFPSARGRTSVDKMKSVAQSWRNRPV